MQSGLTRPAASRLNSALTTLVPREVSSKFNQYHVVPIHHSTVEDRKKNNTTGLTLPRNQDSNEVAEIVAGTASMSPTVEPEEGAVSPDNFFNASDQ